MATSITPMHRRHRAQITETRFTRCCAILIITLLIIGCEPSDRTPGLWLGGEQVNQFPADWSFTDVHKEIFLEVATPYFIPHSVTIWCAQLDGNLYIGAREPETKKWPGWVANKPHVRLKIGEQRYDAKLADIDDEALLNAIRGAYSTKYDLPKASENATPKVKYWAVVPRA